jgi:hypothetical protein
MQYTSSDFVNRDVLFGLLKWARSETSGMDWDPYDFPDDWGIIEK